MPTEPRMPAIPKLLRYSQELFRLGLHSGQQPPVRGHWEAYTYAYEARLFESLRDDFPRVVKKLGEKKFRAATTAFLNTDGARSFSLSGVSQAFFFWFTKSCSKGLATFAELDWASTLAAYAPEPEVELVNFSTVQTDDQASKLILTVHPTVHFVGNNCIWRSHGQVQEQRASRFEMEIFEYLQKPLGGAPFLNLTRWLEDQEFTETQVHRFFAKWSQLGVVIGFERSGTLH